MIALSDSIKLPNREFVVFIAYEEISANIILNTSSEAQNEKVYVIATCGKEIRKKVVLLS